MALIIIGGGNSISAFPNLWKDIRGKAVLSVNHAYKFLLDPPGWLVSIDKKFWKTNSLEMLALSVGGCKLIGREDEFFYSKTWDEDKLFCGGRKLSGVFALSYATKIIQPDQIFLFGFDYGVVEGRTHFYDEPKHSGLGKQRAFLDGSGKPLDEVRDFEHFDKKNIFLIGESNITCFRRLDYDEFLRMVKA